MNKKELREKVGASSVAEITTILRESGRDHQCQEINDQDALFVESVYVLIKQGIPVAEAIQMAQGNGDMELADSSKEHYLALAGQLKSKLITDGKEFWVAYYECLPDAINSSEVMESSEVKEAREKASTRVVKSINNQSANQDKEFFFSAIRQRLKQADIKQHHKAKAEEAPTQPQEVAA